MKKVLIISPQFVPVNSADSHRVRQMLPYLLENGWRAEIVSVKIDCLEKPVIDNLLFKTISTNTTIHYVGAFNHKWTRKIGFGSLSMRSIYHYYIFLSKLLKKESFDLIFFSTTSFHLIALGPIFKRKFKIPYVIDIQDPWRSDYYLDKPKKERPPKFLINYYIDKYLEAYSIPNSDGIISVSKDYLDNFLVRYRKITTNQMVIPFSATIHDELPIQIESKFLKKQDGKIKIVYVGRGGYDLGFVIACFFKAVKRIEIMDFNSLNHFELNFIGTSYAPKGEGIQTIKPILKNLGLDLDVIEYTDRVGYFEANSIIQNADILFIPGSTDPSYSASKIYPYILADKPIIACFHENSGVVEIIEKCSKSNVITFNSDSNEEEIVDSLYRELKQILQNINLIDWSHKKEAMKSYMAPAMTKKICSVFDNATNV